MPARREAKAEGTSIAALWVLPSLNGDLTMQPTTLGHNRTGAALSPAALQAMNEAADDLSPAPVIDTSDLQIQKMAFISESEAVGSVPPPRTAKGYIKTGLTKLKGGQPTVLLDKLGERIAFERSGTRLYDALIAKYKATLESGEDPLLPAVHAAGATTETPLEILMGIRAEELGHFKLLSDAVLKMGGDPTSQTPCADVTAVASMGIMQVLNDPRTTLAQCLNAMLTAELTDNAGWELLITLTEDAGEDELTHSFQAALQDEQRHLYTIKTWLTALLSIPPTPAEAV
jgi:ferritin-like protein